jgi:hypothetical protein
MVAKNINIVQSVNTVVNNYEGFKLEFKDESGAIVRYFNFSEINPYLSFF